MQSPGRWGNRLGNRLTAAVIDSRDFLAATKRADNQTFRHPARRSLAPAVSIYGRSYSVRNQPPAGSGPGRTADCGMFLLRLVTALDVDARRKWLPPGLCFGPSMRS